jgi:hypothetical protein
MLHSHYYILLKDRNLTPEDEQANVKYFAMINSHTECKRVHKVILVVQKATEILVNRGLY